MGADCSQRVCPFGVGWADTPKGDLNSDGIVSGPGTNNGVSACSLGSSCDATVVEKDQIFGQDGTTEAFPAFKTANGLVIGDSGHALAECSSKGLCDRETGDCQCFPGYEGSACQYNSCPEVDGKTCSGHGTCASALEVSKGFYQLWDKDGTQGCVCDSGYEGFDCSMKKCKPGVDPMAFEGGRTLQTDNSTYVIWHKSSTGDVHRATHKVQGTYKISISDVFGKMWETDDIPAMATCDTIIKKIRAIPSPSFDDDVEIRCYRNPDSRGARCMGNDNGASCNSNLVGLTGNLVAGYPASDPYNMQENPFNANAFTWEKVTLSLKRYGTYPAMKILHHDSDNRPTLYGSHKEVGEIFSAVFANGYTSEEVDMFPNACKEVFIRFDTAGADTDGEVVLVFGVDGASETEIARQQLLFEACLGDADEDWTNNLNKESYDKGTSINPHFIRAYEVTQYNCYSYSPWPNAQWNSATCDDEYDETIPSNLLCDNYVYDDPRNNIVRFGGGASVVDYLCANKNPSGINLMVTKNSADEWIFRNKVADDYSDNTPFVIYTMDGIMQNVNAKAAAVSTYLDDVQTYYTNIIHVTNATDTDGSAVTAATFNGDLSCEDLPGSTPTKKQCLNNGDKIVLMSMPVTSSATNDEKKAMYNCNARYTNIYTVKNVAKFPNSKDSVDGRIPVNDRWQNFFIELDRGINARYFLDVYGENTPFGNGGASSFNKLPGCAMYIYKYIVNATVTPSGGYLADSDCSGRGVCDSGSGQCNCFDGYSGDNCNTINSWHH
jgi:hypothetical protein